MIGFVSRYILSQAAAFMHTARGASQALPPALRTFTCPWYSGRSGRRPTGHVRASRDMCAVTISAHLRAMGSDPPEPPLPPPPWEPEVASSRLCGQSDSRERTSR
jgi:hypothetical protein